MRFAMIGWEPVEAIETAPRDRQPPGCPECGGPLVHESGCVVCRRCGHSACG